MTKRRRSAAGAGLLPAVACLLALGCTGEDTQLAEGASTSELAASDSAADASALPAWFVGSRVHINTGMLTSDFDPDVLADRLHAMGATVFTAHVKRKVRDPEWPSAQPVDASGRQLLAAEPDRVSPVIDALHRRGIRFIAYYTHSADRTAAELLPGAVCRAPDGVVVPYEFGDDMRDSWLDVTDPEYRDVVLARLLELAEMGADGFNFDGEHMPPTGCWGTATQRAYEQDASRSAPARIAPGQDAYIDYLRFQSERMEEVFAYWQDEVHRRFPGVVFVVSSHGLARPLDPTVPSNLARIVDVQKNELSMPLRNGSHLPNIFARTEGLPLPDRDVILAFGWTMLRDAAPGRPPRIWHDRFDEADRALAAVHALVGYGAIFALAASPSELADGARNPAGPYFAPALAFGSTVAPFLDGAPLRWGAVHFSEQARNTRGADRVRAWREVVAPAIGAFGAFVREGLPVGIVGDAQLTDEHLAGYQLLYLAAPDALSAEDGLAVERFTQRGGIVIENRGGWQTGQAYAEALTALRAELRRHGMAGPVSLGPDSRASVHVVPHVGAGNDRWLIAVLNDFGWVVPRQLDNSRQRHTAPEVASATLRLRTERPIRRAYDLLTSQDIAVQQEAGGHSVLRLDGLTRSVFVVVEF